MANTFSQIRVRKGRKLKRFPAQFSAEEFTKIGPNMAKSWKEFTVVFTAPAGLNYSDVNGTRIRIGTELYQAPLRQMIFANSRDLRGIPGSEAETILDNVSRALTFLGLDSEIYKG